MIGVPAAVVAAFVSALAGVLLGPFVNGRIQRRVWLRDKRAAAYIDGLLDVLAIRRELARYARDHSNVWPAPDEVIDQILADSYVSFPSVQVYGARPAIDALEQALHLAQLVTMDGDVGSFEQLGVAISAYRQAVRDDLGVKGSILDAPADRE